MNKRTLISRTIEKIKQEKEYIPHQLDLGMEIEKEHKETLLQIIEDAKRGILKPLREYFKEISKDHLDEIGKYYSLLTKMEKDHEKESFNTPYKVTERKAVSNLIKKKAIKKPEPEDLKSAFGPFWNHPELSKGKLVGLPYNTVKDSYDYRVQHGEFFSDNYSREKILEAMKNPVIFVKSEGAYLALDGSHRLNEFRYAVKGNRYMEEEELSPAADWRKKKLPAFILDRKDIEDKEFAEYVDKAIKTGNWD